MSISARKSFTDRMPTKIEADSASNLHKIMASLVSEDDDTKLQLALDKKKRANVILSPAIANTFMQILDLISSRKGFEILPVNSKLTTQQAADILNVPRSFLIEILDSGDIPYTKPSRHRLVKAKDVFAYKAKRDKKRADSLSRMIKLDCEKGYL